MSERAASSGSSQSAHPSTALAGVNQTNGPSASTLTLASGPGGVSAGGNFASTAASVASSSSSPRKVAVPVLVKDGKLL